MRIFQDERGEILEIKNKIVLEINFNCDRKLIVWREEFEGSARLEVI